MLRSLLILSAPLLFAAACLGAEPFVEDVSAFHASAGKQWRTDVLEVKLNDGSLGLRILVLEFAPPSKDKPDQLKVKLSLATPTTGDAFASSSSSISTGGFRDVKLETKDDAKAITITRSIDTVEKPNKNTPRILERTAISFTYELRGDNLTLTGFAKDKPTRWGQLEFTVQQSEITFQKQSEK